MHHVTRLPDGAHLSAEVEGAGPPLLLVPGLASDHTAFGTFLGHLAEHFTVIAVDHRGTGRSDDATFPGMITRVIAEDAAHVLASLVDRPAHVYGHSMGSRTAQWLAIDRPDLVSTLTLGASTGGDRLGVPRPAEATRAMSSGDPRMLTALVFGDGGVPDQDAADATGTRETSRSALEHHLAASTAHDAWDHLHEITAPTLLLHGVADRITPVQNGHLLAAAIPGSELHLLPGAGHMYYLEPGDHLEAFRRHAASA
ncbi:alpha/beta fold hydrolase [Brachybacterium sp. ACRRE]|uniref:alpha/beta fold hydrolase n=1 Tax=Brachybacterium sp. ACRRE TaxID=2918184 RepID=UPI001EF24E3F|nr:alpha/beta hydrolase [Brachybacterium sp. ACRRE]MCG7310840.1 alpha/beta hydrolase [Brachybacterium sp. ACRRE]